MQLAFYKPHKWQDIGGYLIAWWTNSPYSHCELVIDGACYSSSMRDGGVRKKKIDLSEPHWVVVDIEADREYALDFFEKTKGTRYGWSDLITQHVLRLPIKDAGWICSEWCAAATRKTDPVVWHPGMLARHYGV